LPNGFGTAYKLSGNRRKPYIARKTIGWDDLGKRQYLIIGYYATKEEAMIALAKFNDDPYDLAMGNKTFAEIFHLWFGDAFDDESNRSTMKNHTGAFKKCAAIHDMKMVDIRTHHLQKVINTCGDGKEAPGRLKTLFNNMFIWCIRRDYVRNNHAEYLALPSRAKSSNRRPFSKEHIELLWSIADKDTTVQIALMLIYSGVRINELLMLKKEDVDLYKQCFAVKKSKTDAGIRVVPIADKVLPFWVAFMELSKCDYTVCTPEGCQLVDSNFRKSYWKPLMINYNMNYIPHETRHTCISLLAMANINPLIIKKIVGHAGQKDITAVYTHFDLDEKLKAINQI